MQKLPIKDRFLLTISETAAYIGCGEHTIRRIVAENPKADYIITNGNRTYIKRMMFEEQIKSMTVL